ncbi:12765_t:CDS:2 [Entrophospora sp. SA101]|nr:12765_t:CDS:2 [Entrophospora sp. SA101]
MSTVKLSSINQRLTRLLEEREKELSIIEQIRFLINMKKSTLVTLVGEQDRNIFISKIIKRFYEKNPDTYCGDGDWLLKLLIKKNIQNHNNPTNNRNQKVPVRVTTTTINNNKNHGCVTTINNTNNHHIVSSDEGFTKSHISTNGNNKKQAIHTTTINNNTTDSSDNDTDTDECSTKSPVHRLAPEVVGQTKYSEL